MPLAVDLSGVAFGYDGANRVLSDVDLRIEEGEFVAIAGPNGGGKTTLVRLVLGLERPDAGTALLYGEPAHRFSRRAALGYLAQRSRLGIEAPVTVREVVSAGRLAAGGLLGPLRKRERAIVAQAIADVGLDRRRRTGSSRSSREDSSSGRSWPRRWRGSRRCSSSTSRPPA